MSSLASSSRLSPLTPATPSSNNSGTESPSSSSYATSYSARMASAGSSLSRASSISSTTSSSSSRRGSASAASASPVIRNGFIIPSITLTPPDDKPRRSPSLPWQDYTSKSTLYVPVKTEDIGWEEGGLWWHGQWTYPEVQIYGGHDDRVVGKYRGGPEGYRYMEVWDNEGYGHQQPKKMDEPAPQKSSSASSSSSSSSSSSRRRSSSSSTSSYRRRDSTDSLADDSSTASSRRTSDSTVDTACTTPCDTPSRSMSLSMGDGAAANKTDATSKPTANATGTTTIMEEPAPFDKEELSSALLALRTEKAVRGDDDMEDGTAATSSPPLKPGKTLHLSDEGPSATHRWPKGRGVAKLAETPATAAQRLRGSGGSSSSSSSSSPLAKPQSILPS